MTITSIASLGIPPEVRSRVAAILLLRSLFLSLLIFGLNRVLELGTSPLALSIGATAGTIVASALAFSRLTSIGLLALGACAYAMYEILLFLFFSLPAGVFSHALAPHALRLHTDLIMLATACGALSTWGFWRSALALTSEVLVLAGAVLLLLSGHRDFHFDRPQIINALAWDLGLSPLTLLTVVGGMLLMLMVSYLLFAALPAKPSAAPSARVPVLIAGERRALALTLAAALAAGLFLAIAAIGILTYRYYFREAQSRTASGVGQESREKMSPLDFHSSTAGNKIPTALVRLEGDYTENPYSPLLYFRESALSEFNGREMVIAGRAFDRDVNMTPPDQAFKGEPDLDLSARVPLVQSIFLLSDHETAFAVDYPVAITLLKNPNPNRFKASYKAYSVVPAFSMADIQARNVGDPRWDELTRAHYLQAHTDMRYAERAAEVVGNIEHPVEKAYRLTDYLSQHAIYTLTPGHEVAKDEDPVAPFLFGDMRGYCVHFAHAMVYMLRSQGIPARVGTGYLTDLSQSKDGHILLRTNDRHAWAEVYVESIGWVPFDPQPQQVESHAEAPVDMQVLEDLMSQIGPSEEILPKDVASDEEGLKIPEKFPVPDPLYVGAIPVLLLFILFGAKLFLLLAWRFMANPARKLKWYYIASLVWLHDLGFRRNQGETRQEFRARISAAIGGDLLASTDAVTALSYGTDRRSSFDLPRSSIKSYFTWWHKTLGAINPASAIHFLTGGKW